MRVVLVAQFLALVISNQAFAQSRFGVNVQDHHDPIGALVVGTTNGYPCQNATSLDDKQRYQLIAQMHVITEINGVRIGNHQECIKVVFASPQKMTFRVYNLYSGTHRRYEVQLLGEPTGTLDLGRSLSWKPGVEDEKHPHVIASAQEGKWNPAPGYAWLNNKPGDMRVQWKPGQKHPDFHIAASADEGSWHPMPGHDWVSESKFDRRVRWSRGTRHPSLPLVAQGDHGVWQPASGYTWASNDNDDFRVVRKYESTNSEPIYRTNSGSENFGVEYNRQLELYWLRRQRSAERMRDSMENWVRENERNPLNTTSP